MNLIRLSIERPIAVMATVMMIVMFGGIALKVIPIQLIPDVRKPVISISTWWHGAAPAEIEREIINRQEEVLRGLEGLEEMTSRSQDSLGRVTLEFAIGTDMDKSLLLVANRLDRINGYPDEADEPTLDTSGSEDSAIAWFSLQRMPGNERPIHSYGDFAEDVVQDRLERVPGVSRINVYGGASRRVEVIVDPRRMARYGVTVSRLGNALRQANVSVSAGSIDEGKRRYVVRSEGEFTTLEQVRRVQLRNAVDPATGGVARVRVADIAEVKFGYDDPQAVIRRLGDRAIAISADGEAGANVIETMQGVREALVELNDGPLAEERLTLLQIYDETVYIDDAIDLVQQNIWIGGTLAALILFLFLRSGAPTLIVTLAIPVSVIGSFVAMAALGRSINVISLAGIAFAVGMVVDAAIVVLENIYRLRQAGLDPAKAAYEGTRQVWGAVLVSALTTVLVFIPILTMELEVGQLFRDIAVAISVSVTLSLLVSATVIPALARAMLKKDALERAQKRRLAVIDGFARRFAEQTVQTARKVGQKRTIAALIVLVMTGSAALASWAFLPKLEYLPEGNSNMVFGFILPPPGYNLETTTGIAEGIERHISHLFANRTGPRSESGEPPKIEHFFFVALRSNTFLGAISTDPSRVSELIPVLQEPMFREPGTFGFVSQPSIFGQGIGGGRAIHLNISGPDLEEVLGVALKAAGLIGRVLPLSEGNHLRPRPGLELGAPEVRLYPDPMRLADNGISARDFGQTVDAFNDGLRISEVTVDGKRIDLILMGPARQIAATQGIESLPIVTASGTILPVGSLSRVEVTSGPTEIHHLERARTVTLQLRPAPNLPLEAAMDRLKSEVIEPLRADGLPDGVRLRLAGTADKLSVAWDALVWELLVALAIVYLVMAVLFESFIYPLIILFSVPIAAAGGIGGLALLNLFKTHHLDMLTMLGFVILIGIVVNNAILLVHQTLHLAHHEKKPWIDAIVGATRNRIRPIFMSSLTSVFGMLPLVVSPGAGSELYRGLGSVVVGGLALSAFLTLIIIPPLLSLVGRAVRESA